MNKPKGVVPDHPVPHWNSDHKRVAGGRPQTVRRIADLQKRSDKLNIPMWMLSAEEFEKVFSARAIRKQKLQIE